MNDLEKIADELIKSHLPYADAGALSTEEQNKNAIHSAIESVNHTIGVLERIRTEDIRPITIEMREQLELKKILEGRL